MPGKRPFWKTGVNTDPENGSLYFTPEQVERQVADRKARIVQPSDDLAISRIIGVFESATDQDIEEGMTWYQDAHQVCVNLAQEHPTIVSTTLHAAGVIAALSPRLQWNENVRRATQLVVTGDTYGKADWVQSAETIMKGDSPFEVLFAKEKTNWKVRSFFMNIAYPDWPAYASDHEIPDDIAAEPAYVTIDRHCWGMLYANREIGHVLLRPSRTQFNWASGLFALTAKELDGVLPQQLQAITWVAWRKRRVSKTGAEALRLFPID